MWVRFLPNERCPLQKLLELRLQWGFYFSNQLRSQNHRTFVLEGTLKIIKDSWLVFPRQALAILLYDLLRQNCFVSKLFSFLQCVQEGESTATGM